ncbi:phytochelatin synthase family protein [Lusitaniella coriacea]|uniref:phytochelatin synthase family protein n=1 Tax=Lusitaniella coriacea TaxID=1983105 RepID=UPI003CF73FD9
MTYFLQLKPQSKMCRSLLFAASALGLCLTANSTISQTLPLTENLINFNSIAGEELLIASQARRDYLPLSIQFETQENRAYCGVASIVMALNALAIPAPLAPEFGTNRFTQKNVLNEDTARVLTAEEIARQGMTLAQLGQLLATHPVTVGIYHGSDVTLEEFRKLAVRNLQETDNFVLVNYLRRTIGQERGGHISPLAAYNQERDRFLILDVSRYKYPPVWVKAEDLWKAMNTTDSVSGKTRGFVLVSRTQD